jgi:hypothetical protein
MAGNVTPLRANVSSSFRKQQMLDTIAAAFDDVAAKGNEPMTVVFALVDDLGGGLAGYQTLGYEDRNALYVARAVQMIAADADGWTNGG